MKWPQFDLWRLLAAIGVFGIAITSVLLPFNYFEPSWFLMDLLFAFPTLTGGAIGILYGSLWNGLVIGFGTSAVWALVLFLVVMCL